MLIIDRPAYRLLSYAGVRTPNRPVLRDIKAVHISDLPSNEIPVDAASQRAKNSPYHGTKMMELRKPSPEELAYEIAQEKKRKIPKCFIHSCFMFMFM